MDIKDIRAILADKLRVFRERAGLTAKEVGAKVGKSEKTISAWEHGRGQPDADMLVELCSLYNATLNDFFDMHHNPSRELTRDELELLEVFRNLNAAGKELLLANARAFAGKSSSAEIAESPAETCNRSAILHEQSLYDRARAMLAKVKSEKAEADDGNSGDNGNAG